jgi:uncharacterized protein YceH (UPF0502 family)
VREEPPAVDSLLTDVEVRVLGSLIEKELTTPDYYPLSLNALTNACNQSSNREPVVHYEENTVAGAIESLRRRSLIRVVQQSGSRVSKYRHLVNETMGLVTRQTAVLCVLMLRGPQTLGELRTRTERLAAFESLDDVEATLEQLMARTPSPIAVRLPRQPGQKELRYAHLLAGEVTYDAPDQPAPVRRIEDGRPDRVAVLEQAVEELRRDVADLRGQLDAFRRQFE